VQEKVYDVEADGGVRPSGEAAPSTPRDRTVELLDALRGRRGRRQPVLEGDETATQGDLVDELLEDADAPPPAHPPVSRPQEAVDAELLALPEQPDDATGATDATGEADPAPDARPDELPQGGRRVDLTDQPQDDASSGDEEGGPVSRRPARARSRQRRAAVPSWDDIVFGAKKD